MQCIRNGIPQLGVRCDEDVSRALKACVAGTGLEAVSELLRLGSCIRKVTSAEQEIPYSGGDMMDVVSAVEGGMEDCLELQDSCPLPAQSGGAVNLAVETAVEVMNLARDSLEQACLAAVRSEEPLVDLAGTVPLQALLLAARVRFTAAVEAALPAGGGPLGEAAEALRLLRVSALQLLGQEPAGRRRLALGALQALLLEQEHVARSLAAAAGPAEAAALWEPQVRFYFLAEDKEVEARCRSRKVTVGFEYEPRQVFQSSSLAQRFRSEFLDVFNMSANAWKALLVRGPSSACLAELCEDTCTMLGLRPAVLHGASLQSGDTFWRRATMAAKSTSGGVFAVLIVSEAHKARKDHLDVCVDACKEKQVALCLVYDPTQPMDFSLPGCTGARRAAFEVPPCPSEEDATATASALLGAAGFVEADVLAPKLLRLLGAVAALSGRVKGSDWGLVTLRGICEEAGAQLSSGGGPVPALAAAVHSFVASAGSPSLEPEAMEALITEHLG